MSSLQSFYRDKKIFITGNTGFKGSWLSQWLLQLGAKIHGYSDRIPTDPSLFVNLELESQITQTWADIRNYKEVCRAIIDFQPHIVFHLAAQPLVRESYDSPRETFEANVMGTVNLLEALRGLPTFESAVIITSDKCYENQEWEVAYRETDPMGGKDPYSASKGCSELVFSAYYRSFFKNGHSALSSARAGNVIGGGDWAQDRIVADIFRAVEKNQPLVLRSPKAYRPWQHVLEALGGYLILAKDLAMRKENHGKSYNFGPQVFERKTVLDIVKLIQKDFPDLKIEFKPDHSKLEASLLILSSEAAGRDLGWTSVLSTTQAVQLTSQWYKSFLSSPDAALALTKQQIENYTRRLESVIYTVGREE